MRNRGYYRIRVTNPVRDKIESTLMSSVMSKVYIGQVKRKNEKNRDF